MTEKEMVGWHYQLDGHEFEQALGDDEGQGSLECCSPWGHKESDTSEHLNNTTFQGSIFYILFVRDFIKSQILHENGNGVYMIFYLGG